MEKTDGFAVVSGIVLIVAGVALLIVSFFFVFVVFYALIALALGIAILTSLKEQEFVEPIKGERAKKRRR